MCVICGDTDCTCSGYALSYEGPTSEEVPATSNITVQGHPIWAIDEASDIALFNAGTGVGSGIWLNWALCDGQSHTSTGGDSIGTPDLRNRFIVGALDDYAVGATGGATEVILSTGELPSHNHGVADAGHNHTITIQEHTHTLTDAGHTHSVTDAGHDHGLTIDMDGSHSHTVTIATGNFGTTSAPDTLVYIPGASGTDDSESTSAASDHSHQSSTVDSASTGVAVDSASTGITLDSAVLNPSCSTETTGITIGDTGANEAHENLPPYYALVFIKYIG